MRQKRAPQILTIGIATIACLTSASINDQALAKSSTIRVEVTEQPPSAAQPKKAKSRPRQEAHSRKKATTPTPAWKQYWEKPLGYSLDYPASWKREITVADNVIHNIFKSSQKNVTFDVTVIVDTQSLSAARILTDLDTQYMRKYGSRYRLLSIASASLANKPAATWDYVLVNSRGLESRMSCIAATYLDKRYLLTFSAPETQLSKWQPVYERVAGSFRYTVTQAESDIAKLYTHRANGSSAQ